MSSLLIMTIGGALLLIAIAGIVLFVIPGSGGSGLSARDQMNRIVQSQRQNISSSKRKNKSGSDIMESAEAAKVQKVTSSRLTLEKRLKYAQWRLPPVAFNLCWVVVSVIVVFFVNIYFNQFLTLLSILSGPIFMNWLLNLFMDRRFKRFDSDYPAFLASVVSLLKTGMDSTTALETAAQGLEEGSLVKEEVILMMERLRFGVPEEKSIGSFGEDIFHPEIELFVQALLLSRRVGGNLSETLNRLAKQVRKRQYFRQSATASVGMQRGSIWIILGIMVGLEFFLYVKYPQVVTDSIENPTGWQVWQGCIVLVLLGIFWVRQVTKLRI